MMTHWLLFTALAVAAPGSATVVNVSGKAEIVDEQGTHEVKRYMQVPAGATVVTYEDSRLSLRLASGTLVRLADKTRVALTRLEQGTPQAQRKESLKVSVGRVWAKVTRLFGRDSSFELEMPNAVAGVRGTSFFAETDGANDRLTLEHGVLIVRRGEERRTLQGPGATLHVGAGGFGEQGRVPAGVLHGMQAGVGGAGASLLGRLERRGFGHQRLGRESWRRDIVGPDRLTDAPFSPPVNVAPDSGPANLHIRLRLP